MALTPLPEGMADTAASKAVLAAWTAALASAPADAMSVMACLAAVLTALRWVFSWASVVFPSSARSSSFSTASSRASKLTQ